MTTERDDEQEAPGVMAETEDDDAKGHVHPAKSDDPDFRGRENSVYPPAASDEHTDANA